MGGCLISGMRQLPIQVCEEELGQAAPLGGTATGQVEAQGLMTVLPLLTDQTSYSLGTTTSAWPSVACVMTLNLFSWTFYKMSLLISHISIIKLLRLVQ